MPDRDTAKEFDLVIIGAGPAGASAALTAACNGLNVMLVDRHEFPRDKVCGDGLTPLAVFHLHQMGFTREELVKAGGQAINGYRHYCNNDVQERPLATGLLGVSCYALGMRRIILDYMLWQRAVSAGAIWCGNTLVKTIERNGKWTVVHAVRDRETICIRARLAILATGSCSPLYRNLAFKPFPDSTLAVGMRQYFRVLGNKTSTFDFFYEPYLPNGYAWYFPVGGNTVNLGVWSRPQANGKHPNLTNALEQFIHGNSIVRRRLDGSVVVENPKGACLRVLSQPVFALDGLLLAGDAAGSINNETGEGISFALSSGRRAAKIATKAIVTRCTEPEKLAKLTKCICQADSTSQER